MADIKFHLISRPSTKMANLLKGGIQLGQNSFYQMSQIKYLSMSSVETILNLVGEKNTDNRMLLFRLKKYKK